MRLVEFVFGSMVSGTFVATMVAADCVGRGDYITAGMFGLASVAGSGLCYGVSRFVKWR